MNKPEIPPPKSDTGLMPDADAPGIRFEVDEWLPYFEDTDLTYEQKCETAEALFNFILSVVDLYFGMNPTQAACGEKFDIAAILQHLMVDSDDHTNAEFNQFAKETTPKEETL
ncbi:hypothetical protein [Coralliovum pocilloporae]|uniref:hypothetical protein n=1 Tax=Coralliovum pocilloporae TaxID=3066369 RepID=UPI0033079B28